MAVRKGYKMTEVGVIPVDWEVKKLFDLAEFSSGTTPKRELHNRYFNNGQIPWVKTMDLNNSSILNTSEKVTEIALKEVSSLKLLPKDSVLVAMYGGFNQIGRTGLLKIEACLNQAITAIRPNYKDLDSVYLLYLLNFQRDYWKEVATSSRKDPNITSNDVKNFSVTLPKIPEQKAIAQVLSDTDNLLQTIAEKLDKKRAIKQGAMQELLRAKEGWEVRKLGEVASIIGGGTPSSFNSTYWNGDINWFTPTEIGKNKYVSNSKRKITKEGYSNSSTNFLPIGTILLTTRAGIGDLGILMTEACTNQGFQSLVAYENIDNEFLYYLMGTLKKKLLQNASGSTFLEISPNKLRQIEISIPTKQEQTRIATILSDMDAEIEQLEEKLSKYERLKQGLMQQLLTGKVRLV